MFVARVIGTMVSTCKEPGLVAQKLLVVQDINEQGSKSLIAVDGVGAGVGEIVLVVQEGGAARGAIRAPEAPINVAIVGILDYYDAQPESEEG